MEKERNHLVLSLGSNESPEEHFEWACAELRRLLPDIRFSEPCYTDPVDWPLPDRFLNSVARATTSCSQAELIVRLKKLEARAGRTPERKSLGFVPLDLDLLCWNGQILKPADWQRPYIRQALAVLFPESKDDERRQQEAGESAEPDNPVDEPA